MSSCFGNSVSRQLGILQEDPYAAGAQWREKASAATAAWACQPHDSGGSAAGARLGGCATGPYGSGTVRATGGDRS